MPAPESFQARRSDRLGAHSLDHIGLTVPDFAKARRFYEAFGLDVREAGGGLDVRA